MSAPPPGLPDPLPPDENRGSVLVGAILGLLIPAILILMLRVYVRAFITRNMGWDDWLMITAAPFLFTGEMLSVISVYYGGVGRHIFYLDTPTAFLGLELNVIGQPLNVAALFFIKASIVALLLRLKLAPVHRIVLLITIGFLATISVIGIIMAFAQCQPFARNWDTSLPGFCWPREGYEDVAYILSAFTIVTDAVYIVIPILHLWNVQIAKGTKIGILAVIGLGLISMACSIAALPFLYQLNETIDVTFGIITCASIKVSEANVAMIVGCMPPLHPLFKKVSRKYFSNSSKSGKYYEDRVARQNGKPGDYEMLSGPSNNRSQALRAGGPYGGSAFVTTGADDAEAEALAHNGQPMAYIKSGTQVARA